MSCIIRVKKRSKPKQQIADLKHLPINISCPIKPVREDRTLRAQHCARVPGWGDIGFTYKVKFVKEKSQNSKKKVKSLQQSISAF